jgi:predicted ABC-type ATPase
VRAGVPDRPTADWPGEVDGPRRDDVPRRDDGRSAGDLSRRLDSLPDGHPSSPYEADGTRREPPARLRDLDTSLDNEEQDATPDPGPDLPERTTDSKTQVDETRPYTDAEWAEHKTEVRTRLSDAHQHGLDTRDQFTIGPDKQEWTWERNRIQGQFVADLYDQAKDVPCDGLAIIAGGLGGAGKSTVLEKHIGIDLSQYLVINPDKIKEEMARRGLVPEVAGLSPMEASELVHEEASHIAKRLALRATADHKNVIWDITMSSQKSTAERIDNLQSVGYSVDAIFVDIPVEVSIRRADSRHREDEDKYRAGDGLGGRYVAPEIILAQADPDWGSQNRKTFEAVSHRFEHWSRYDNSVDGRPPVLVETNPEDDANREENAR